VGGAGEEEGASAGISLHLACGALSGATKSPLPPDLIGNWRESASPGAALFASVLPPDSTAKARETVSSSTGLISSGERRRPSAGLFTSGAYILSTDIAFTSGAFTLSTDISAASKSSGSGRLNSDAAAAAARMAERAAEVAVPERVASRCDSSAL